MLSRDVFSVGVDRGGTWTRVVAIDAGAKPLHVFRGPSPTLDQLPSVLKSLFKKWRVAVPRLAIASRGVWTPAERRQVRKACRGLARELRVISDVEAAWLATFRETRAAGILVIAGTGSIAYARDPLGRLQRAGGLGPLLGDEGSGFWIGREWFRAGRAPLPRGVGAASIAAQAPLVLAHAQGGDRLARRIVRTAQAQLAELVLEISRSWPASEALPLGIAGSVLADPFFRRGFLQTLRSQTRRPILLVSPAHDAANAAAHLFFSGSLRP